ncbi:NAD-dependent deacylase [Emticicia sp. BO119]|uniref:SIR2 family NAD-dependent protein deacylase n=1 Tax=Emticicia sp. BO119 TaxID=2757768 RepID=UPI0015F01764|nr:NAD-dependent deacylase [Emticicia sp. BO119]MBA4853560.1 NAD-dependent deacylase [Emticicia sp. BO119]
MKKLVVLTGAGISAESGLKTFRDSDGLWENHRIEDVATPEGWAKNPALVLKFYNDRRVKAYEAKPNAGHMVLAELEKYFDVSIITQNVDNLHEKAGSTNVLHLHGELTKVRSVKNQHLITDIGGKVIEIGDLGEDGYQLRPHIVWFGEAVPMIEPATVITKNADIFVVIGTSLQVYPAAGLINFVNKTIPKFIVDPTIPEASTLYKNITFITETASVGVPQLARILIHDYQ